MKKIACIDLGTNAIRFIIYGFDSLKDYQVLYKHRAIIRVGQGVFAKGLFSKELLAKIPVIFNDYMKKAKELGVDRINCVATSSVREATNGAEFLSDVERLTGLHFKSLTGAQEARLLALALQWNQPAPHSLIYAGIDIGGGSTEVFWYHDQGYIDGISMPIGTVRVLEHFCDFPLSEKQIREIRSFVQANAFELHDRQGTMIPHRVFGISGLLQCIFDLMHKEREDPVHYNELEAFISENIGLKPGDLQEKYEIEKNRSEILLPGTIILTQLMMMGGFRQIYRAEVGLRDGMAVEEAIRQGISSKALNPNNLRETVIQWAYGLIDKYAGDMAHAQYVDDNCQRLHDRLVQMGYLTGQSEADMRNLRVAAILHDIGSFVNYQDHEAHSRYIILNSQSPFLSDLELELTARLAYHHENVDNLEPVEVFEKKGYTRDEYEYFCQNLAILHAANAMDYQHRQVLHFQELRETRDHFELIAEAANPESASEEVRAFKNTTQVFERFFGKPILLKIVSPVHLH